MTVREQPLPTILSVVQDRGHVVFTKGLLNLNIIGVRSSSRQAGAFDDELRVVYKETPTVWVEVAWPITTDPGLTYLHAPMRTQGCAILCPGQYRSSHRIGMHKGRYPALVQEKPMRIVRDNNRDAILNLDERIAQREWTDGVYGINIHAADNNPFDATDPIRTEIGPWSAGCQVFRSSKDYREFWMLVLRASRSWGPTFTYTLVE
jgi:hypothetical protein